MLEACLHLKPCHLFIAVIYAEYFINFCTEIYPAKLKENQILLELICTFISNLSGQTDILLGLEL